MSHGETTKGIVQILVSTLTMHMGDNTYPLFLKQSISFSFNFNREQIMKWATNISRKQLLSLGTCIGKFTHSGKFRLIITALDIMAPYSKVRETVALE